MAPRSFKHGHSITTPLPILPAICATRPSPWTSSVINQMAVQAAGNFQSCPPLERNQLLRHYLEDKQDERVIKKTNFLKKKKVGYVLIIYKDLLIHCCMHVVNI